jgi:hypothetical protein
VFLDVSHLKTFNNDFCHFSESAFQHSFANLDRLLTQPDGLRLCSTFSTSNIDNSVMFGQFTSRTNPTTAQTHRPNSSIFAEDSPKRNGMHNGEETVNGLVHVVKSRPAPPRKFKNAVSFKKLRGFLINHTSLFSKMVRVQQMDFWPK